MIQFEGNRNFPLPLPAAFQKLSDAAFLVGCLPDAKIESASPDRAVWKLKPKLSFMTGSLDAVMDRTRLEPEQCVSFQVVSKAIGASATVLATLHFQVSESSTDVHWTGELVAVTGLLKMVPKGLLQGTAEKVIEDTWQAVEAKLTSSPTP